MTPMPWFRLYADFAWNRKVQRLSEADQRRYAMLMCLHTAGKYEGAAVDDLAFELRITEQEMAETIERLKAARLLDPDGRIHDWDERQFVSDTSAARTRRYRERKSGVTGARHGDGDVTSHGRHCDVTVTPSESDSDSETEGDSSSSVDESTRAAAGGAAPESPPVVADAPPEEPRRPKLATRAQQQFAARLLAPHRLTVAGWLEAAGHDELLDSHVDEIRARYGGRQPPPAPGPRAHELPQAADPDLSDEDRAASAAALAAAKANGRRSTGNTKRTGAAAN